METRMIKQTDAFAINHTPDGGLKIRPHPILPPPIAAMLVINHNYPDRTRVPKGPVDMSVAHYHRRRD
jgi:hypothetical protein